MDLPKEVDLSPSDQAAAMELLHAVRRVFAAGCVHLRPDQRDGAHEALQAGHPLEMRVRMLPEVFVECVIEKPDGSDYMLFQFAIPPAGKAMDFRGTIQ